ncbi:hypothetical protein HanXRQr2_Chr14g0659051 [Helianthus annuus]|uniref:Uncharacterized protein n=1 Tax=Helianthus annuus TaxID=4232 RepID=A0A9K3EBZ3_HELAN|nr:hypothetical protein HanXRQr2_Chr14g0659051 [Helianthus annuus]KAJ0841587.1 hypothetical protein HanPSC8_Chr14g0632101 [Helianthus annuus]
MESISSGSISVFRSRRSKTDFMARPPLIKSGARVKVSAAPFAETMRTMNTRIVFEKSEIPCLTSHDAYQRPSAYEA